MIASETRAMTDVSEKAVQRMMSAAKGSSNAAIPGISHVYKIQVPRINAAANLAFSWGGATKYMSGCERGYATVGGLKEHLHGNCHNHYISCTDSRCISQATEYPLVRRRAKALLKSRLK
jgi:hypothetical protein